jgi:HK97 family phage portal protein
MNLFRKAWWYAQKAVYGTFGLTDTEIYYRKFPRSREILGYGNSTFTDRPVSEATALNCSTVWCCTRIISETVAALPLHLMRVTSLGKTEARDHPLFGLLHDEPNEEMSDMEWREVTTAHALTYGNGYARRVTKGDTKEGQTIGLFPIFPNDITPDRSRETKQLVYLWKDGNSAEQTLPAWKVFHLRGLGFDGLKGYSVIRMARQSIALAQIQEEYASRFFAKGGRRPYLIKHDLKFRTDQEFQAWNDRWIKAYGTPDAFHAAPMLDGKGVDYQELGWSMSDAQFLEGRQFSVPEICRWFLITPHKVFDLTHATFSNVEHLQLGFYQETILPWCVRWEKAIRRCLLTPAEKVKTDRLYARHNISGLLRGDFASRMAGYATQLQNAMMNPDEMRDLEDLNPLPDGAGKAYHIQMNMQTLPGTGEPTSIEKSALARAAQAQKPAPQQGV